LSHLLSIARGIYSMPPNHGASIVAEVLSNQSLMTAWLQELDQMRERINGLRAQFSALMAKELGSGRFDFVESQRGMFSFLGLTPAQVALLAKRQSIYMLSSSRASIAGLNDDNLHRVCGAIAELCREEEQGLQQ